MFFFFVPLYNLCPETPYSKTKTKGQALFDTLVGEALCGTLLWETLVGKSSTTLL